MSCATGPQAGATIAPPAPPCPWFPPAPPLPFAAIPPLPAEAPAPPVPLPPVATGCSDEEDEPQAVSSAVDTESEAKGRRSKEDFNREREIMVRAPQQEPNRAADRRFPWVAK